MGKPLFWGLTSGLACFVGLDSFLGLTSEPVNLIFQILSIFFFFFFLEVRLMFLLFTSSVNQSFKIQRFVWEVGTIPFSFL